MDEKHRIRIQIRKMVKGKQTFEIDYLFNNVVVVVIIVSLLIYFVYLCFDYNFLICGFSIPPD